METERMAAHEYTIGQYRRDIDANQTGTFCCMKYALTQMLKQNSGGSIVNMGSIAGSKGVFDMPYAASKWAVRGMTEAAAAEYADRNIRVNSIASTVVETPMGPASTKYAA